MNGAKLIKEMNLQIVQRENDINDIVNQFDAEATKAMNKLVPTKQNSCNKRKKIHDILKKHKRVFRNRTEFGKDIDQKKHGKPFKRKNINIKICLLQQNMKKSKT